MKQIILITDGCSNVGIDPVIAAAQAKTEGITVNVIGVIDEGEIGELGATEIADIAKAGDGISRIVSSQLLSQTVQMMTRKTVASTIHQAINQELRQIMGNSGSVEALPPDKRGLVVQVMDEMAEEAKLRVVLLVDASASMKPKLPAVQEAVQDLMLSLQARSGVSELAVLHFPGGPGQETVLDMPWTRELAKIRNLFYKINMKGTTPTGPALLRAVRYITDAADDSNPGRAAAAKEKHHVPETEQGGMLSDYVV